MSGMLFEAHPVIGADRAATKAEGAVGLSALGLAAVSH